MDLICRLKSIIIIIIIIINLGLTSPSKPKNQDPVPLGSSVKHDPSMLGPYGYPVVGSFSQAGPLGVGSSRTHQCWVPQDPSTLDPVAIKTYQKALGPALSRTQYCDLFFCSLIIFSRGKEEILLFYYCYFYG